MGAQLTAQPKSKIQNQQSKIRSLMPQGLDRVHPRRHDGRVEAEADSDQSADDKAADDRPVGDAGGVALVADALDDPRQQLGGAGAQHDADQAAGQADDGGLDEELQGDMAPLGAQGPADADLAGALGHRRQHDVHDADPADHQREAGDAHHDEVEHAVEPLGIAQDLDGGFYLKVGLVGVAHLDDVLGHRGQPLHLADVL